MRLKKLFNKADSVTTSSSLILNGFSSANASSNECEKYFSKLGNVHFHCLEMPQKMRAYRSSINENPTAAVLVS